MRSVYSRVQCSRSLMTQLSVAVILLSPSHSESHAYYTQAQNLLRRPSPSNVQTGYGTTAACRLYPVRFLHSPCWSRLPKTVPDLQTSVLQSQSTYRHPPEDILISSAVPRLRASLKANTHPWRNLHLRYNHEKRVLSIKWNAHFLLCQHCTQKPNLY